MNSQQHFAGHISFNRIHLHDSRIIVLLNEHKIIVVSTSLTAKFVYLEEFLDLALTVTYFSGQINVFDIQDIGVYV